MSEFRIKDPITVDSFTQRVGEVSWEDENKRSIRPNFIVTKDGQDPVVIRVNKFRNTIRGFAGYKGHKSHWVKEILENEFKTKVSQVL